MTFEYQERLSPSPFIERVWTTYDLTDGEHIAPADGCWDLILTFGPVASFALLSGPTCTASRFQYVAGSRNIGIRFHPSTYIASVPVPQALGFNRTSSIDRSGMFEMFNQCWPAPDYNNAENLIHRFADRGIIRQDKLVTAILDGAATNITARTAQRRFGAVTGLPPRFHSRIRMVNAAVELLRAGHAIADVAYATSFSDQAHLTRVLKRYTGMTPAEVSRTCGAKAR